MVRAGLIVLAGCGRLSFDPALPDDAHGNTSPDDVQPAACTWDLCEGFEAPTIDTSLWTVDPMVTRDTAVARRGNASARMHVDALAPNQAASAALTESRTLTSSRELWVRAWFRLSALPAGMNELEVIGLSQSSSAASINSVYLDAAQVGFTLLNGISAGTMVALPLETWFCLVWHVRLANSGGAMDLAGDLFDGPDVTGGQTDTMPPLSVLRLGARFAPSGVSSAQPPLDLWLDDLIVHSTPVTCAD